MTLLDLKQTVDADGRRLINILYSLYQDLFHGYDVIDDIGHYTIDLVENYGKQVMQEFENTIEMKELLLHAQKVDQRRG